MKIQTIFIVLVLFAAVSGYSKDDPASISRGAAIWAKTCTLCHNIRGGEDFRDDQWKLIVAHMRVRSGLTGQEARDVLAFLQSSNNKIIQWVESVGVEKPKVQAVAKKKTNLNKVPVVKNRKSPKTLYDLTCLACHGADGKGAVPGAPDFTSRPGVFASSDKQLLRSIMVGKTTPGKPIAMPPKGSNPGLDGEDAKRLIKYIRETFK